MTNTLILVHPGSLMGSAKMHLGAQMAREVRERIFLEVSGHEGALLVVDGFLSDELAHQHDQVIDEALERASAAGHLALRVWGDDGGTAPFATWQAFPRGAGSAHVYECQVAAICHLAGSLPDGEIILTGAWVDDDYGSGCVRSVEQALRGALGSQARIEISDTVARMPSAAAEPVSSTLTMSAP